VCKNLWLPNQNKRRVVVDTVIEEVDLQIKIKHPGANAKENGERRTKTSIYLKKRKHLRKNPTNLNSKKLKNATKRRK